MKVYIIYDRYEHDEWYDISWIGTNKEQAIKQFKEQELPSFLEYGPDDCHSFQLVEVEMTDQEYKDLLDQVKNGEEIYSGTQLYNTLYHIYHEDVPVNEIYVTDGCSDNYEVKNLYMSTNYPDLEEESDEYYDKEVEFYQDDDLYREYVKKYIELNY